MANNLTGILAQKDNLDVISVTTGQLDIVTIPVTGAPSWIVPQSLILDVKPHTERVWTLLWQGQDVAVYHLFPEGKQPSNIVILESISDVYRIGLQIEGDITYHSVRIVDLQDVDAETYHQTLTTLYPQVSEDPKGHASEAEKTGYVPQFLQQDYVFQPVMLQGQVYVVPDLDKLSHFLVDLDD